jgi:DNA-binding CsgD family transcriptional regulator
MWRFRIQTIRGGGSAAALAGLLVLQAVTAVFFVGDVVADLTFDAFDLHVVLEAMVAVALVVGVVFASRETRRVVEQAERSEAALAAARSAFGELIQARFLQWRLTQAEGDVALLALKGFDTAEIARIRGAAEGTVRAQLTRVYAKAAVSSRAQLVSLFVDELLGEPDTARLAPTAGQG